LVTIYWTDESKRWLKEIFDYLAEDNRIVAYRVITGIIQKIDLIKQFPLMGQPMLEYSEHNIRFLLYGHYRIVYLVISDLRIDILGIYHGSLDIKKHLFKIE
jgi:toxin ParE1/3/4